jgi:hypothetical protein
LGFGTPDALDGCMATINQPEKLPKHGPTYTFYLLAALAVLVVIATMFGLRIAGTPHWF